MGKIKLFPALEWLPGYSEGLLRGGGSQGAKAVPSWSPEPEINREETAVSLMRVLSAQA